MTASFNLRPLGRADDEFAYAVYEGTRAAELAQVNWGAAQQEAFLRMQFAAQRRSYAHQRPLAEHDVIETGGRPAGRLIIDRSGDGWVVVDLALLPEARGAGVGTAVLIALQAEARSAGRPLCLQVIVDNPAVRLYRRLGFEVTGANGLHLAMTWRPNVAELPPADVALERETTT